MLVDLETKLNNLKEQILMEETSLQCQLSKEDIVKHFSTALKKSPEIILGLLVDKIVLYDDKMEIYYKNLTNKSPDNCRDFLFYTGEIFYNKTRVVKNTYITQTNNKKIALKLLQFIRA